jgi:DNA-binding CsgD family transcriptional regulator
MSNDFKTRSRVNRSREKVKPTRNKSFVKLQQEWYNKLKKTGFVDIEFFHADGNSTDGLLRNSIGSLMASYTPEGEYYYRKARWFLQHHKFTSAREKKIWSLHCEGMYNPAIGKIMGCSKEPIRHIVNRLRLVLRHDRRFEEIEAEEIAALAERINIKVVK